MLEFEQLPLQVHHGPEQHPVQIFPPDRADQPLDKWMGERHIRKGLNFYDLQYPQIGLPWVEAIQRIMIRSSDTSAGCYLESRDRTSGTEPHRLLLPGGPQTQ